MNVKRISLVENISSFFSGIVFLVLAIVLFCLSDAKTNNALGAAVSCLSIAIVLLLIPLYRLICHIRKQATLSSLDERQVQVHLIAFIIAFFLLALYVAIIGLLDFGASIAFAPFFVEFLYGLVGTGLFVIIFSIWNDSFINVKNQRECWSFIAIYLAIGISNLSLGISDIANMVEGNQLTANSMYIVTALFNFIVAISMFLKNINYMKRNDEK
ncbi:MAG: hypothetical protein WCR63_04155 [Bacilli bacterium]